MNTMLQKIATWHAGKEQRALEQWEKIRANGKPRFVLTMALSYTGVMILARGIFEYLFDGSIMVAYIGRVLFDLVAGFVVGLWAWWNGEREYRNSVRLNP